MSLKKVIQLRAYNHKPMYVNRHAASFDKVVKIRLSVHNKKIRFFQKKESIEEFIYYPVNLFGTSDCWDYIEQLFEEYPIDEIKEQVFAGKSFVGMKSLYKLFQVVGSFSLEVCYMDREDAEIEHEERLSNDSDYVAF